jgi:hypothetical protein
MKRNLLVVCLFLGCAILFSLLTVSVQVRTLGLPYLETDQLNAHTQVLLGKARNPYQYRILSEYLVEGCILALTNLGFPHPVTSAFVLFRVVQNTTIFLMAALYYKKLGLNWYVTLIALSIVTWGMTYSTHESDLAFNTFFDIIFYLAAGLLILHNRCAWTIPIVGIAAFNRETSGLIPLMLVLHSLYTKSDKNKLKYDFIIATVTLGLYACIFLSLRYVYGEQLLSLPDGNHPGLEIFTFNMFRYKTWVQLFATLGILPILAMFSIREWPRSLQAFFWAIFPIWLLVHPFFSVLAESRLLLVPFILVFVPGALFGVAGSNNQTMLSGEKHLASAA